MQLLFMSYYSGDVAVLENGRLEFFDGFGGYVTVTLLLEHNWTLIGEL